MHEASLRILATIGVHVPHEEMLGMLAAAGADVCRETQIVKLPEKLVLESLEQAGKRFVIYGRDRTQRAQFGFGRRNYNSIAGEALWLDDNLERRYATLDDVRTASRLADALPRINIVGAMSDPHELPPSYRCVVVAAEQLRTPPSPSRSGFTIGPRRDS